VRGIGMREFEIRFATRRRTHRANSALSMIVSAIGDSLNGAGATDSQYQHHATLLLHAYLLLLSVTPRYY
jgi:hypothetical protein